MCGHAADNVGRQGPLLPCHAEISLEVVKAVRDNRSNLVMFSKKQQQGFFEGHANGATGWSVRVAVLRGLQEPVRQDGSTA